MSHTVSDLVTRMLTKIRAARAGDVPSPEDMQLGLDGVNGVLDMWNTDDRAVYVFPFSDFTLVPNTSPHTIGPAGSVAGPADPNFVVAQRPVEIKFASVNLGNNVFTPINVRDRVWYANQPTPALTQTFPTDLYYAPEWDDPNNIGGGYGKIYFWGVPTVAYAVRLWLRVLLANLVLTDTFSLPQGYYQALFLTGAEMIAEDFGQPVTQTLADQAREARAAIFGTNVQVPRARSKDVRTRAWRVGGGNFNYGSRTFND